MKGAVNKMSVVIQLEVIIEVFYLALFELQPTQQN